MKVDSWNGLVTNASPFSIPVSAAVEQVNLAADIPGQIYSRGGMRPVASVSSAGALLDVLPYYADGRTFMLAMDEFGALHLLESPAYGAPLATPTEPSLVAGAGTVATSYTYRYLDGRQGAASDPESPEPPAPVDPLVESLDGGTASTTSWQYVIDANAEVPPGKLATYEGGTASTSFAVATIRQSQLVAA